MYAHKRLCFDKAGRRTIGGTKQQHEKFNIFYHWICTGISSAFFMEFTVFQTAQEEEKRRVAYPELSGTLSDFSSMTQ